MKWRNIGKQNGVNTWIAVCEVCDERLDGPVVGNARKYCLPCGREKRLEHKRVRARARRLARSGQL